MIPATGPSTVVASCIHEVRRAVYADPYQNTFTLVKMGLAIPLTIIAIPAAIIEVILRIVTLPLIALSLPFTREPMLDALISFRISAVVVVVSPVFFVLNIIQLVAGICNL